MPGPPGIVSKSGLAALTIRSAGTRVISSRTTSIGIKIFPATLYPKLNRVGVEGVPVDGVVVVFLGGIFGLLENEGPASPEESPNVGGG